MRASWRFVVLGAVALVAGTAGFPAQALPPTVAGSGEPNPIVTGPIEGGIHGYMWNHSLYPLSTTSYDYTENEYFYSGYATSKAQGQTVSAPYRSRFFVRLPRDPKKFNGIVSVEWLNVTDQDDLETVFPPGGKYLMDQGFGIVGVSAQLAGVCCGPTTLVGWDPKRYATLLHPGDQFAPDIFTQAIQALRHPELNRAYAAQSQPVDPMLGMRVKHVVATGASQSASQLTNYINSGYNSHHLVDLFLITRGGGPFFDTKTPIWQLNEEAQPKHVPDTTNYRLWEEAGTAHAPAAWYDYVWAEKMRDQGVPGVPNAVDLACGLNRGGVDLSTDAMTYWVKRHFATGANLPSAPRLTRDSSGNVVRDGNTLAKGGLRHPFIQVPVAINRSETTDCPLFGYYQPFSSTQIKRLYKTHASYVRKIVAWTRHEVAKGFMIAPDRRREIALARSFTEPWRDGTCFDTYNAMANENGPLSAQIAAASHDASLPVGTSKILRDANCNAFVPLGL